MGCGPDPQDTPRPHGYFRIDLPEKHYRNYTGECPFSFDIPDYAEIGHDTNKFAEPCWINVEYKRFHATLHLSYKVVNPDPNAKSNTLRDYLEQSRALAVQHQVKANAMKESPVMNDSANVYGLIYEFGGNTASSLQFYVTDSTKNFMRGALYFFARPNSDSVAPVYEFLKEDVYHMIETFKWNNEVKMPEGPKGELLPVKSGKH
jgi:gliding motility-associated lipoprotein GldD